LSSFDSQRAKDSQNAQIVVGVVGGNTGSRHVNGGGVGGWYGERRSMERHVWVLSPPANIVIWGAAAREVGAGSCQFTVISFWLLVFSDWLLVNAPHP